MVSHINVKIDFKLILILLFLLLFIVVFSPVFKGLINTWSNSADYSHGFLIIPISLYIIWMKRYELAKVHSKPSLSGLVFILISLLCYIVSRYAGILALAPVAMLMFVFSCIVYLYGFKMIRVLLFPLFFLLLMLPIPSQIYSSVTLPLQLIVTKTSVAIAMFFSIPILRDGNVIHMSDTTLQVVAACSGLRSIVSLFALCTIFGYLTLKTNIFKIALCVSAVFIAVFVNIVRILAMIFSQNFFHYDLTHGPVHDLLGILLFLLSLTIVYILQKVFDMGERKIAGYK